MSRKHRAWTAAFFAVVAGGYFSRVHAENVVEKTGANVTIKTSDATSFAFPGHWQPVYGNGLVRTAHDTIPVDVSVARMLINSDNSHYKQINDGQIRLLDGSFIVNARAKPVFVSEVLGSDKLMVRIAPGATALVSTGDTQTVANLSQRCCGAVLIYVPAISEEESDRKINVLPGEVVSIRSLSPGEGNDIPPSWDTKVVKTTAGPIVIKTENLDIDGAMQTLSQIAEGP
jgi:hypothetical protein